MWLCQCGILIRSKKLLAVIACNLFKMLTSKMLESFDNHYLMRKLCLKRFISGYISLKKYFFAQVYLILIT